MMYVKWLVMVPAMLLLTAAAFPLAIVLPFFSRDGWLPNWLAWFQTPDNSLYGDDGWKTEHWMWRYKLPSFLATYVGMVGWLWRNPAYGFGCITMTGDPITATYTGNKDVNDSPLSEGYIFVKSQDLFQLTFCKRIGSTSKCVYVVIGWNIKGLIGSEEKKHIATYAFSPRISTIKL